MQDTLTHQAAFLLSLEDRLQKTGRSTKKGQAISDSISGHWRKWDADAKGKIISKMSELKKAYSQLDWEKEWTQIPGVN